MQVSLIAVLSALFLALEAEQVASQFDFGGGSGDSCSGSGTFQQNVAQGTRLKVGDIPAGLEGLEITLSSPVDVDIQLTSGSTEVINWQGGILTGATAETRIYNGDSITYSGYNGDGTGLGNEFVNFNDATDNAYTMYAYGYAAGSATVDYSWTGTVGCTESSGPAASGSGEFSQAIPQNNVVVVGDLPAGLQDVYVRLDSSADIDIQLFDGSTPVVDWQNGIIKGGGYQRVSYAGVTIQYSGYNGEQRSDALGQEYLYIEGTLPKTFTLKVLGYAAGSASVKYSWGYYSTATSSSGSTLKSQLHEIIDGHTPELPYSSSSFDCWDALKRTDQDPSTPDNVILLYSRRSEPKANQDNGSNGQDAWNREHVYAKSHGDFGTTKGAGTDIHALRAADKSVNTERSAKDFDDGGSPLSSTEPRGDCPDCLETNDSFEPPDEVKGDVARMLFYMAVRYNGDSNSNGVTLSVVDGVGTPSGSSTAGNGEIGDLMSLLAWHAADPVSDEERHRNNIIFDIQGNRNPFIDNPQFVGTIFA